VSLNPNKIKRLRKIIRKNNNIKLEEKVIEVIKQEKSSRRI